jgi:hypothetical protein
MNLNACRAPFPLSCYLTRILACIALLGASLQTAVATTFADVPSSRPSAPYIDAVSNAGIDTGCGGGFFCPTQIVTRELAAALVVRSIQGELPDTYCASGSPFSDVPATSPNCKYIKRMLELGIATGCGGNNNYCPTGQVDRAHAAAFIVRAIEGNPVLGYCSDWSLSDVASTDPYCGHIRRMFELGIVSGCGTNSFCPNDLVTRESMAILLGRAFLHTKLYVPKEQLHVVTNAGGPSVPITSPLPQYAGTTNYSKEVISSTKATVIAPTTANTGSGQMAFQGWTGCSRSLGNVCIVSVMSETTVVANYAVTPPNPVSLHYGNFVVSNYSTGTKNDIWMDNLLEVGDQPLPTSPGFIHVDRPNEVLGHATQKLEFDFRAFGYFGFENTLPNCRLDASGHGNCPATEIGHIAIGLRSAVGNFDKGNFYDFRARGRGIVLGNTTQYPRGGVQANLSQCGPGSNWNEAMIETWWILQQVWTNPWTNMDPSSTVQANCMVLGTNSTFSGNFHDGSGVLSNGVWYHVVVKSTRNDDGTLSISYDLSKYWYGSWVPVASVGPIVDFTPSNNNDGGFFILNAFTTRNFRLEINNLTETWSRP